MSRPISVYLRLLAVICIAEQVFSFLRIKNSWARLNVARTKKNVHRNKSEPGEYEP